MDFKSFLPGNNSSTPKELFWSLVLEPTWVQAGIWEIVDSKARIISISPVTHWETQEEFIDKIDTALSSAIQQLPQDIAEPSKTIFGVVSSWVEEGQIKPEYLQRIKLVCEKLALVPQGFVILPEAIAHLIKSEEGSPVNAIILGVTDQEIEMSVFRLGNLSGITQIARSVSVLDDVIEGLSRFASGQDLPSRFILYDGKGGDLEEIEQTLVTADWDSYPNLKFLHTPKIEIVHPEKKVCAVSLAGGAEMAGITGVEIASFPGKEEITQEIPPGTGNISKPLNLEDVGFVMNEDIAKSDQFRNLKIEEEQKILEVEQNEYKPSHVIPDLSETPVSSVPIPKKMFTGFNLGLGKLRTILNSLAFKFPKSQPRQSNAVPAIPHRLVIKSPKMSKLPVKNAAIVLFGLTLFGLVIGALSWWFLPKATVTIFVSPKRLEESIGFTADTKTNSSDFTKNTLAGMSLKVSESGEKTVSTTGVKTIGDRAKGTLQIRNGTASAIRFPAGTIVVSSAALEFSLDSSASVSGALSPTSPGTANVAITARNIGSEYNLAKDESFKVSNYPKSEVDAIVLANLTGGSSRQISAVAVSDQKDLENTLKDELTIKAQVELANKVNESQYFVKDAVLVTTTSKTFSNKVGDEASNLKLSLAIDASGVAIDKKPIFDFARSILQDKIPAGFVLRDEQIILDLKLINEDAGKFEIAGSVEANLLPEIKPDDIASKLVGKYPSLARAYLTSIPGFNRAEIKILPALPGRLGTLPHIKKNITIEVSAN